MKKFPGQEFHVKKSREIPGSVIPDIRIDFTKPHVKIIDCTKRESTKLSGSSATKCSLRLAAIYSSTTKLAVANRNCRWKAWMNANILKIMIETATVQLIGDKLQLANRLAGQRPLTYRIQP